MAKIENISVSDEVAASLDDLASVECVQANCMFQLALMLARIAVEPCSDAYKDETAQALMGLIRTKPKSNVVRLFSDRFRVESKPSRMSEAK